MHEVFEDTNIIWVNYFTRNRRTKLWTKNTIHNLIYKQDVSSTLEKPKVILHGHREYYDFLM